MDTSKIPQHMTESIATWVRKGQPHPAALDPFLRAVLSNDLQACVREADDRNLAALVEWSRFIHWEVPGHAHGTKERLAAWHEVGGLEGIQIGRRLRLDARLIGVDLPRRSVAAPDVDAELVVAALVVRLGGKVEVRASELHHAAELTLHSVDMRTMPGSEALGLRVTRKGEVDNG